MTSPPPPPDVIKEPEAPIALVETSRELALAEPDPKGIGRAVDMVRAMIDRPFIKAAEGKLTTLRAAGPSSDEKKTIDDSVKFKYAPVLRNSTIFSLISAPFFAQNPQAAYVVFGIISSLTGLAWFSMSLKDVKAKFAKFGIELTADMLEAFLTSLFLVIIIAGYGYASQPMQQLFAMIGESGSSEGIIAKISSSGHQFKDRIPGGIVTVIQLLVPLAIMLRIGKKLVDATIKFDANDAMLTGSTDDAQNYFRKAASSLHETARLLRGEHTIQLANYQIALGLENYLHNLNSKGASLPQDVSYDSIKQLRKDPDIQLKNFDLSVIPLLQGCLVQYAELFGENKVHKAQYDSVMDSLASLQASYVAEGKEPKQSHSDAVIAHAFEILAEFLDAYNDRLA